MKILVIAAHPDDEVLGCGGTIARQAAAGDEIHILILATGLSSRVDFEQGDPSLIIALHYERARRAATVLGAKSVEFAGFPDQKMDTVPLLEVTRRIEKEIEMLRPEAIYTHHGGDLNMDHVITHRATLTATRPMAGNCVRALYAYEVPSSTEWAFQSFEPKFKPNIYKDISKTLKKKVEAMCMYESETRSFPHPRSTQSLEAIAARWGAVVGVCAAEAFELIREIR